MGAQSFDLDEQRRRALKHLREVYGFVPHGEPIFALISASLNEERGFIEVTPSIGEPNDRQWDRWTLVLDRNPEALLKTITKVMSWEDKPVPVDPDDLPEWAARLAVLVLDELGLYP